MTDDPRFLHEIFKAYDIRGVVGKTLTAPRRRTPSARRWARWRGSAAATRSSSAATAGCPGPSSSARWRDGIRAAGADVIDIGMVATPMTYFAAQHLGTQCSVMVTGSHNPPDYNGLKMVVAGDDAVRRRHPGAAGAHRGRRRCASGAGAYRTQDIGPAYLDRIVGDVRLARPMKIAIDCGNGVAGAFAPALYRAPRLRR